YCATCEARLSGNLTESGADAEIGECEPTWDDANGWDHLDDALVNVADDDPRWRAIAKVIEAARRMEWAHDEAKAELTASPGMTEARTSLLGLLAARAVQKA